MARDVSVRGFVQGDCEQYRKRVDRQGDDQLIYVHVRDGPRKEENSSKRGRSPGERFHAERRERTLPLPHDPRDILRQVDDSRRYDAAGTRVDDEIEQMLEPRPALDGV